VTSGGPDLFHPNYPRANGYDPEWVVENLMGPHPLWLLESLAEVLFIDAGQKVLDLGCGKALTSVFLAREFGARVWATDLWIDAESNRCRIEAAGVGDLVEVVHAEAHNLPFEAGFFDAIVSVDAYQYFGTADLYIGYATELLREGGRIGIVVPSLVAELGERIPEELTEFWEWDYCCWHSPQWWRAHWDKTKKVKVDHADPIHGGWEDWLRFCEVSEPYLHGWMRQAAVKQAEMLRVDRGKNLGFARVAATKVVN